MAFRKTISLLSGVAGDYIRISAFRWDRGAREASVIFSLYKDTATASTGQPLVPVVAKLRLTGPKFDEHLGNANLSNILQRIYQAARAESVISDFGAALFGDAEDI